MISASPSPRPRSIRCGCWTASSWRRRVAAELVLLSPLDGWAAPLAEVPDPVFAQAMLGDGVAIDPTSAVLHAPCDAVVINVHASRHAVSLRAAGGLELLLHVGLETVVMNGEGYTAQVTEGQQ